MPSQPTIHLFTDFGYDGPYVGQLFAAIRAANQQCEIINLMHDAPAMRPDLAAYLLPAVTEALASPAWIVGVVDPGVGSERPAIVVRSKGRTFVGPDNGLLSRLPEIESVERIDWRPTRISASFHGRDLFAPAAARLAGGEDIETSDMPVDQIVGADWDAESARVIYVDRYGNLMTGLSAKTFNKNNKINCGGRHIVHATTFSAVPPGEVFWYENSQGLVELAANGVSASDVLSLATGDKILVI